MTRATPPPPAVHPPSGQTAKRLQMADIARLAGVSVATVSRALNGNERISAETRQRVEELARSLNYTINVGAKNLRLRRNRTVAVVIPRDLVSRQPISDPFFLAMVGSLADALTERGFDMLLSRVDAERLDSMETLITSGVAMGVILIGQWRHHDQLNALAARHLPVVVWGAKMPRQLYRTVGGDNSAGGYAATRHLLELGCRRIVFVGDTTLPEVAHRHRGYLRAHQVASLQPDPALLLGVPFNADDARLAIARLCDAQVAFDAVFACSDVLASASMQVLQARGRQVPQQVRVVGYDDIEWASHSNPPLTTVRQPVALAGVALVTALMRTIEGGSVSSQALAVELVIRDSTVPATPHGL